MSAVKWHEGPMVALDTETTGTDVHTDRIVTAAIVHIRPGERPRTITWIIDPGIDIPAEAAEVHGWTNDRLRERLAGAQAIRIHNGREERLTRDGALFEIAAQAATAMHTEAALVLANAAYDLSLLEAELVRHDIDTLSSRPDGIRGVVDPMVIEKQYDPYRKVKGGCRGGKTPCGGCGAENKTLTGLCLHYKVRHTGAHDASADALAAVRLIPRLVDAWPQIGAWKLSTLHNHQVTWRRDQMDGLRSYFDKIREPHDGCCGSWPLHGQCCAPARVGGAA